MIENALDLCIMNSSVKLLINWDVFDFSRAFKPKQLAQRN